MTKLNRDLTWQATGTPVASPAAFKMIETVLLPALRSHPARRIREFMLVLIEIVDLGQHQRAAILAAAPVVRHELSGKAAHDAGT